MNIPLLLYRIFFVESLRFFVDESRSLHELLGSIENHLPPALVESSCSSIAS